MPPKRRRGDPDVEQDARPRPRPVVVVATPRKRRRADQENTTPATKTIDSPTKSMDTPTKPASLHSKTADTPTNTVDTPSKPACLLTKTMDTPTKASTPSRAPPPSSETDAVFQRDSERRELVEFLDSRDPTRSLYIAGSPGTGKSALVRSVLASYRDAVYVNCVAAGAPSAPRVYAALGDALGAPGKSLAHVVRALDARPVPCILVLDELDALGPALGSGAKSAGTAASSLLATVWNALHSHRNCVLIGVANTLDLADRASLGEGTTTLPFTAYSAADLAAILRGRFGADALHPAAAMLVAKKCAAASSDVRRALAVCRAALRLNRPAGVKDVVQAFTQCTQGTATTTAATTGPAQKVRALNLTGKLAVVAVLVLAHATAASNSSSHETAASPLPSMRGYAGTTGGFVPSAETPTKLPRTPSTQKTAQGITPAALYAQYASLAAAMHLPVLAAGEFADVVMRLETLGVFDCVHSATPLSARKPGNTKRSKAAGSPVVSVTLAVPLADAVRGLTSASLDEAVDVDSGGGGSSFGAAISDMLREHGVTVAP